MENQPISVLKLLVRKNSIATHKIVGWQNLTSFLFDMTEHDTFAWRGQSNATWPLYSSFDRIFLNKAGKIYTTSKRIENAAKKHLEGFKYAVRGKYPFDPILSLESHRNKLDAENEWWALGQHYGLKTPLLDWTYSPFVALYFALRNHLTSDSLTCALWGIKMLSTLISLEFNIPSLSRLDENQKKNAVYRFFSQQTANNRLISQAGFFTRAPFGVSVDEWVRDTAAKHSKMERIISIIKIEIALSQKEIHEYMRFLQKMNINEMTLFPEVQGAAGMCNAAMEIDKYYRWK